FAGLHPVSDQGEIALRLAGFYLTQFQRQIGFHHENIRTVLPDLDRGARHQLRVFQDVEDQSDLHELRRPQGVVRVRRDAAQLYRAGAGLHGVIDEIERAWARLDVVPVRIGHYFQVRIGQVPPNEW